jgi:hypothetical protein
LLGDLIIWSVAIVFLDYLLLDFIVKVNERLVAVVSCLVSVSNLFRIIPVRGCRNKTSVLI